MNFPGLLSQLNLRFLAKLHTIKSLITLAAKYYQSRYISLQVDVKRAEPEHVAEQRRLLNIQISSN